MGQVIFGVDFKRRRTPQEFEALAWAILSEAIDPMQELLPERVICGVDLGWPATSAVWPIPSPGKDSA